MDGQITLDAKEDYRRFSLEFSLACERAGRDPGTIEIIAVTKGQPAEKLQEFSKIPEFPRSWGENYLNELESKAQMVPGGWHYMGSLQSKKLPRILEIASVLHSVSRTKELEIMKHDSHARDFYLQVNIASEAQKLGASFAECKELLAQVLNLGLEKQFLGFMAVASDITQVGETEVRKQFATLREFKARTYPRAKLNMGMSGDYPLALLEGTDVIRIGSAIFGERAPLG